LMLSPLPAVYGPVAERAGFAGLNLRPIIDSAVWPLMLGLTGLLLAQHFASERRDRLGRSSSSPAGNMNKHTPYWIAMAVVVAAGIGVMVYSFIAAERVAARCEVYAQKHRVLPNQVVNCPFD